MVNIDWTSLNRNLNHNPARKAPQVLIWPSHLHQLASLDYGPRKTGTRVVACIFFGSTWHKKTTCFDKSFFSWALLPAVASPDLIASADRRNEFALRKFSASLRIYGARAPPARRPVLQTAPSFCTSFAGSAQKLLILWKMLRRNTGNAGVSFWLRAPTAVYPI